LTGSATVPSTFSLRECLSPSPPGGYVPFAPSQPGSPRIGQTIRPDNRGCTGAVLARQRRAWPWAIAVLVKGPRHNARGSAILVIEEGRARTDTPGVADVHKFRQDVALGVIGERGGTQDGSVAVPLKLPRDIAAAVIKEVVKPSAFPSLSVSISRRRRLPSASKEEVLRVRRLPLSSRVRGQLDKRTPLAS